MTIVCLSYDKRTRGRFATRFRELYSMIVSRPSRLRGATVVCMAPLFTERQTTVRGFRGPPVQFFSRDRGSGEHCMKPEIRLQSGRSEIAGVDRGTPIGPWYLGRTGVIPL
jgi:hypothetical protein